MLEMYQKLDLYFDQMLSFILAITLFLMIFNGVIQTFVLASKGWDYSLKSTLIISGVVSFLFFIVALYMYSYGRSGGISSRAYWLPLFLFFFSSLVLIGLNYGINLLIEFNKTGVLHKKELIFWFSLYIGLPLVLAAIHHQQEYKKQYADSKKVLMPLRLIKSEVLPIYIRELKFINSTNHNEAAVDLTLRDFNRWTMPEAPERIRDELDSLNSEFLSSDILIPEGADQILLSWYSFVDHKAYKDLLPIDLARFDLKKDYPSYNEKPLLDPSLRPPKASTTLLRFRHGGSVDILAYLNYERQVIYTYSHLPLEPISDAQVDTIKSEYLQSLSNEKKFANNLAQFSLVLDDILLSETRKFNWNLILNVDANKVSNMRYTYTNYAYADIASDALSTFKEQLLPSRIEFYAENESGTEDRKYLFFIDSIALLNQLKALPAGEEVSFHIEVNSQTNKVWFYIKSHSLNIVFQDFGRNINNRDIDSDLPMRKVEWN